MKHPEGLEWAIHSCSILANMPPDFTFPPRLLAQFFELPELYFIKQMQKLSAAGIVRTKREAKDSYVLAKPPAEISLLALVEAIDSPEHHFRCTELRRSGPSGVADENYLNPCGIARAMWHTEAAWRDALAKTSLAGVVAIGIEETPIEQAAKAAVRFRDKITTG